MLFTYDLHGVPLVCDLDYFPAERGTRERGSGVQLEPDYPASCTLNTAKVNKEDIYVLLKDSDIALIEEAFLIAQEEE